VAVSTIPRRQLAVLVAISGLLIAASGALAVLVLVTRDGGSGPVLLRVDEQHGLHLGDLPLFVVPMLGLALVGVGHRLSRRVR
jgi:hypothetical protein